jgi:uncharacterized protein YecE (DUF72 family)
MRKGKIHIGTSGWSYKHWKDIYYPKGLKSTEWLVFYSNTFSITEINNSFYHLPQKQTVEGWVKKTPSGFLFCPKMNRFITHIKRLKEPEEPVKRFFEIFRYMQKKIGPILIQLPPSLKFDYDRTDHFFSLLKKKYKQYDFALEVRDEGWLSEDSLGLMAKYGIAFVIAHSGNHFPYGEHVTAKNIYVRFHGPSGLYSSNYTDSMLKKFAKLFRKWMKAGHTLWVFFNNDVHGYAIENAKRLQELMNKKD